MGLIARGIEEQGISTVCTTFRKDLIELAKPPRILSLPFPPGKPLGNPGDRDMQRAIIEAGFDLLQGHVDTTTTVELPFKLKKFGLF